MNDVSAIKDSMHGQGEEEEESNNNSLFNYSKKKIDSIQWDKDYGVKKVKSDYRFENAKITFNNDKVNISDTSIKITPGLFNRYSWSY